MSSSVPVPNGANASGKFTNDYPSGNDPTTAANRARIGGSGFTVFVWDGQPISFARQISHQSPQPVGQGVVPIHPLDSPYPVQLVTPQALTMGTIVLELYELYGSNVWQRLTNDDRNEDSGVLAVNPAQGGPVDLAGIFHAVASSSKPIHIYRVINPPVAFGPGTAQQAHQAYTEEYHNCVVSSLEQGETIEVGTMEVLKRLTVNYTHITQGGHNSLLSAGTALKNISPPPGP